MLNILITVAIGYIVLITIIIYLISELVKSQKPNKKPKKETTLTHLRDARDHIQSAIGIEMKKISKDEQIYGSIAILNGVKRDINKVILAEETIEELNIKPNREPSVKPLSKEGQSRIFLNQAGIIDKSGFL